MSALTFKRRLLAGLVALALTAGAPLGAHAAGAKKPADKATDSKKKKPRETKTIEELPPPPIDTAAPGTAGEESRPAPPPEEEYAEPIKPPGDRDQRRAEPTAPDREGEPNVRTRPHSSTQRYRPEPPTLPVITVDFIVGALSLALPIESKTVLDLGVTGTVDMAKYGFGELRYQHASNSFANSTLGSSTGYHTLTAGAGLGIPFWLLYGYGVAGLSWELARFTHTLSGNNGEGEWSTFGSHIGALVGAGIRLRVPSYVPVELRVEGDYKRRSQYNDFGLLVMVGVPWGWGEDQ